MQSRTVEKARTSVALQRVSIDAVRRQCVERAGGRIPTLLVFIRGHEQSYNNYLERSTGGATI